MITVLSINKDGNKVVSYTCSEEGKRFELSKEKVVELISEKKVKNAKVQIYKGRVIVRVKEVPAEIVEDVERAEDAATATEEVSIPDIKKPEEDEESDESDKEESKAEEYYVKINEVLRQVDNAEDVWEEVSKRIKNEASGDSKIVVDFSGSRVHGIGRRVEVRDWLKLGALILLGNSHMDAYNQLVVLGRLNKWSGQVAMVDMMSSVDESEEEERELEDMLAEAEYKFGDETEVKKDEINVYMYKAGERFDSTHEIECLRALLKHRLSTNNKVKRVNIEFGKSRLSDGASLCMAEIFEELGDVQININIEDKKAQDKINAKKLLSGGIKLSYEERLKRIKEAFKPGELCVIGAYKNSKKVDRTGRYGKGELAGVCPGIVRQIGESGIVVECIVPGTLKRREEASKELKSSNITASADEMGLEDQFIGSRYHLEKMRHNIEVNGEVIENTIEEVAEILDSWGIEHNYGRYAEE